MEGNKALSLNVPVSVHQKLKELAHIKNTTMTELIVKWVTEEELK